MRHVASHRFSLRRHSACLQFLVRLRLYVPAIAQYTNISSVCLLDLP